MTNIKLKQMVFILSLLLLNFVSWGQANDIKTGISDPGLSIDFEKYELDNGLNVVLHQDKSDPIVSVAIQYGVGSNREKKGRTGFAHLFEHMLFQESENVPQDQFFKMI